MCDKKTSSIVHVQQAPVERVAELMTAAETELAAFYEAVFRRYGLKEARKAAQDWIEDLEMIKWPGDWALPNWRHVTMLPRIALPSESSTVLRADEDNRPPIRTWCGRWSDCYSEAATSSRAILD
jgi:hypothetical protein